MKPIHTVMKFNLAILLVLLTINTGAAAQNSGHSEEAGLANSSARWQLPSRNLSPGPFIERLSYNPVRATRLNRSPEQGSDKKNRSDLQWKQMGALPPGARLVVEQRDGGWVRGRFSLIDGENLTLRRDGTFLDLARPDILRIQLRGERQRTKGGWVGLAAGALVGSLVSGAACQLEDGFSCGGAYVGGGIVFGLLGAGVGAGVGATIREKTLIYEAHSPELLISSVSPARGVSPNPRAAPLSNQAGPGTPYLMQSGRVKPVGQDIFPIKANR